MRALDEQVLRAGSSAKWAAVDPDVLPAWVAEMDFGVPPAVRAALLDAVDREDFGYPYWNGPDPAVAAFEERMRELYAWDPAPGRTRVFTNLIQVLQVVIEHATEPGDGIAVHVPAYPPFLATIERAGRRIIPLEMRNTATGWAAEHEDLTGRLRRERCRLIVLVNPHNPTGAVLPRAELAAIARTAEELDALVLADEIHAELTYAPHRHVPFASLGEDVARRTITTTSPSKAYNLAGLRCAVAHIGPDRLESRLAAAPLDYFGDPSGLGRIATAAAWRHAHDWHRRVMEQLDANRTLVGELAAAHPIGFHQPRATYLAWLDFAATPYADDPAGHLLREARVQLSPGPETSQHTPVRTDTFARLNFGTDRATLHRILERLDDALRQA